MYYTTYRLTFPDINVVIYLIIFFQWFICQICYAPPPKKPSKLKSTLWHASVNHQSASVFGTIDYGMSLPINWQPVNNSIAFSYNGSSQTCIHNYDLLCQKCQSNIRKRKAVMGFCTKTCNAIRDQLATLVGKRHTNVFCSKYASWLMIDRW